MNYLSRVMVVLRKATHYEMPTLSYSKMKTFVLILLVSIVSGCFEDMGCFECISLNCIFFVTDNGAFCANDVGLVKTFRLKAHNQSKCHEADVLVVKKLVDKSLTLENIIPFIDSINVSSPSLPSSYSTSESYDSSSSAALDESMLFESIDRDPENGLVTSESYDSSSSVTFDMTKSFEISDRDPENALDVIPESSVAPEPDIVMDLGVDAPRAPIHRVEEDPLFESSEVLGTSDVSTSMSLTTDLASHTEQVEFDGKVFTSPKDINQVTGSTINNENILDLTEQTSTESRLKQSSARPKLRSLFAYIKKSGLNRFNCERVDTLMLKFERSLCRLVLTSRRLKKRRFIDPDIQKWVYENPVLRMNEFCAFVRAERAYCKRFGTRSMFASSAGAWNNFNFWFSMFFVIVYYRINSDSLY